MSSSLALHHMDWTWNSRVQLGWLASESLGPICLYTPSPRCAPPLPYLRSQCLHARVFTHWAIFLEEAFISKGKVLPHGPLDLPNPNRKLPDYFLETQWLHSKCQEQQIWGIFCPVS